MKKPVTCVRRVLLIEDNRSFRILLKSALESLGCEVLEADDGISGCEVAEVVVPESILLELTVPNLHGFEVLKRLRSKTNTKHIPILILSSLNDPDIIRKSFELGADEYIVKGSEHPIKIARRCLGTSEKAGSGRIIFPSWKLFQPLNPFRKPFSQAGKNSPPPEP